MSIKSLAVAATLAIAATSAFATPQYSGDTFGSEIQRPYTGDAGYYLWNDETSPNDWHIRWTAPNTGSMEPDNVVDWYGQIVFRDSNLGSTTAFRFETGGSHGDQFGTNYDDFYSGQDDFGWRAKTNTTGGVDGIDFTIDGTLELMELSLGSSLFRNLDEELNDPGVASSGIFIGSAFNDTNVLVSKANGRTYQNFEISVSEPGTIVLLGLGLAGLGLARRKQA